MPLPEGKESRFSIGRTLAISSVRSKGNTGNQMPRSMGGALEVVYGRVQMEVSSFALTAVRLTPRRVPLRHEP
jgi:hypothetical protein